MRAQVTLLIAAVCAALMLVAFVPTEAHAISASNGAKVKTMKMNKTYKCDINGDKKQEKVRITFDGSAVKVLVNGSVKYTNKSGGPDFAQALLITLKNGRTLLYYSRDGYDYKYDQVLCYKSGKMKSLLDSEKLFPKSYAYLPAFGIEKVSGNSLFVQVRNVSYSTGWTTATFKYTYKNGALKRATSSAAITSLGARTGKNATFKAARSMKAYTSAKCTKAKFTIKKGQKVEIKKIYFNSKMVGYQVKTGNKTGWIKGQTQKQYFKYSSCLFDGLYLVS